MVSRDTRHFVRIGTLGGVVHMQVNHTGSAQEWDVTSIDLYADANYIVLVADDVQLDQFPEDAQARIVDALNEHAAIQRRRAFARRFAVRLQDDLRGMMGGGDGAANGARS